MGCVNQQVSCYQLLKHDFHSRSPPPRIEPEHPREGSISPPIQTPAPAKWLLWDPGRFRRRQPAETPFHFDRCPRIRSQRRATRQRDSGAAHSKPTRAFLPPRKAIEYVLTAEAGRPLRARSYKAGNTPCDGSAPKHATVRFVGKAASREGKSRSAETNRAAHSYYLVRDFSPSRGVYSC